jgi:hypothetical protein
MQDGPRTPPDWYVPIQRREFDETFSAIGRNSSRVRIATSRGGRQCRRRGGRYGFNHANLTVVDRLSTDELSLNVN